MDQNSMPPGGASDRPLDGGIPNPTEGQAQPASAQDAGQSPPAFVPPPPSSEYTPQGGQPTQAFPQEAYAPPPGYPQPQQQGYAPPQQGGPPPGYPPQGYQQGYQQQGYPPQGYPQGTPPPGYAPPPGQPPGGYSRPGYTQEYGPQPKKRGMPVWGWVLIGVGGLAVVMCGLMIAFLTYLGAQVSSQVNSTFTRIGSAIEVGGLVQTGIVYDFYDNMQIRDYEAAHDLLGGDLAGKYTVDDLRARWEALEETAGTVTADFPYTEAVGSQNTTEESIVEELTSEQGETYTIKLKVETSGSTWKITQADPDLIPSP